jgi:hypothetical protein
MPNDSIYPVEQLNKLASAQNLSPTESSENKFFALDRSENSEINHSDKNKRKFVCVELLNNKLQVENYSNKDLAKVLESDEKVISLVFYVKNSEKEKLANEIKGKVKKLAGSSNEEKFNTIKEHFKKVWKNFTPFASYHDISEAYDQVTGEPIIKVTSDLSIMYSDIKKRCEKLKEQYGERSEKYQKILQSLEVIVKDMEKEFADNRDNFQHLSTDTVSSVIVSFKKLKEKFEEESKQLEIENSNDVHTKKLELLEKDVIKLQTDCEKAIPSGTSTEEIFEERKEIKRKMDLLLITIQDLKDHTISDATIKGVEEKFKSLQTKLVMLTAKINSSQVTNLQVNSDETNINQAHMDRYFQENIQPILENIENHAAKTSEAKAGILKQILAYLNNIKEKIISNSPLDKIKDMIKEIKIIINTKSTELAAARGFFSNQSKSARLIEDLVSKLDELPSQNYTIDQGIMPQRP